MVRIIDPRVRLLGIDAGPAPEQFETRLGVPGIAGREPPQFERLARIHAFSLPG